MRENFEEKISPEERVELKNELKKELKQELKERKVKKPKLKRAFCLGCLIIVLGVIFAGLVAIAKTGLIKIPLFSQVFYQPPAPVRVVAPESNLTEAEVLQKMLSQLERQVAQGLKTGNKGKELPFELSFTEQDLTTLLRQSLSTAGATTSIQDAQFAITPEELEIFGRINEPIKSALTIGLKPQIEEGRLRIEVTKIRLGTFPAPRSLANFLIDNLLKSNLNELNKALSQGGFLESLELGEGVVKIRGKIKK